MAKVWEMYPQGVGVGVIGAQVPNTNTGDLDFSRTGVSNRLRDDGDIEAVASNVAKINYINSCPSLTIDPQRENLCINSNDLSLWSNISVNTTITTGIPSLIKGFNSSRMVMPDGSGSYVSEGFSAVLGVTYTFSLYIKNNGGDSGMSIGFGSSGAPTSKTEKVISITGEWGRYEVSFESDINGILYFGIDNVSNTSSLDVFTDGYQVEESKESTSLINTSGVSIIRPLEDAEITDLFSSGILTTSDKTVFYDIDKVLNDSGAYIIRVAKDSGLDDILSIGYGMVTSRVAGVTVNTWSIPTSKFKIAFVISGGSCKIFVNGSLSTTINVTTENLEVFKARGASGGCTINSVSFYNEAVSDSIAESLTT